MSDMEYEPTYADLPDFVHNAMDEVLNELTDMLVDLGCERGRRATLHRIKLAQIVRKHMAIAHYAGEVYQQAAHVMNLRTDDQYVARDVARNDRDDTSKPAK